MSIARCLEGSTILILIIFGVPSSLGYVSNLQILSCILISHPSFSCVLNGKRIGTGFSSESCTMCNDNRPLIPPTPIGDSMVPSQTASPPIPVQVASPCPRLRVQRNCNPCLASSPAKPGSWEDPAQPSSAAVSISASLGIVVMPAKI